MCRILIMLILFAPYMQNVWAQEPWITYYEKNDYNRTPQYLETVEFSKRLASASPMLYYTSFGNSHQGREIPLLILDKNGNFSPGDVRKSGNRILMVQAAIHPGEPVGKDAGLTLIRDMVIHGKHLHYLDSITLLFIPILNVDGHERFGPYNRINQNGPEEMGWRTNALNLNLNRDYLKADSKEIRAFLNLWHLWQPDFFIDTHSTNGGDYQYTMTYAMDIFGGANTGLVNWITERYLPEMEEKMEADNYPIFQYVTYRSWHDPRSGLVSGVGHPMYSNGYISQLNRPGLLLETHMLKPYKMRVESTYLMILHTMNVLYNDSELRKVIEEADHFTASSGFRENPLHLRFRTTDVSEVVDFLGVEYEKKISTLTGGNWFRYEPDKPVTYQIPWYKKNEVTVETILPEAYIIPVEHQDVIERLLNHHIQIEYLAHDTEIPVQSYRFENVSLSNRSNEGRQNATYRTIPIEEKRMFHKGSAIVNMNQQRARIIAHALEPDAPGSFAYWGFFNVIFQRVEYFESYVMEKMAREMLETDPDLSERLREEIEKNPSMKNNQSAILTWFYEQTPYYDSRHNIYPVGRILEKDLLNNINFQGK
jgi:hypothetical protein